MDHKQIAKEVLEHVGGIPNIKLVAHCTTRLRFELIDREKADKEAVEAVEGVFAVVEFAGQFQVVIGFGVYEVYGEVNSIISSSNKETVFINNNTDKFTLSESSFTGGSHLTVSEKPDEIIYSPLKGKVMALSKVTDQVFASSAIGQGIAIIPTEGKVVSPVDGIISAIFYTNHAIGISSDNGAELLIHIGMNTVQLEGKYFNTYVKEGDHVSQGQKLMTLELDKIQKEGYEISTPVVITNSDLYDEVIPTASKTINYGEILMNIVKTQ